MKRYLLITIVLIVFLSSCLPYNVTKNIEFDDSFKLVYVIGDDVPNFGDSFINNGSGNVSYEVDSGYLDMNAAGVYLVVISVYEEGNRENELIIELKILINDSIL